MLLLTGSVSICQRPVWSDRHVDGDMLEIDGIHESSCRRNQTHSSHCTTTRNPDFGMAPRSNECPKTGFAVEIDGRIKAEFNTREDAENGAIELKRRFPALRIRLYDAETQSRHDVQA